MLRATAEGLLPTYQNRRALLSLTELLGNVLSDGLPSGGPGRASRALEGLASLPAEDGVEPVPAAARLPWIPASVDPPGSPEEWRWGVRVAQRVLQLQLDALRAALLVMTVDDVVEPVIRALHEIGRELHSLATVYDDFVDPLGASVQAVQRLLCDKEEDRRRALEDLESLAHGVGAIVYS